MCYSAGELGADRFLGKSPVARHQGVSLPFAKGSAVAVKNHQQPPLLAAIEKKDKLMKNRFLWASAVALAATVGFQVQTLGLTNGFIVITSRTAADALYRQISSSTLYDSDDFKGPGVVSPGDVAMATLLQDYGYSTRVVPEWLLSTSLVDPQGIYSASLPAYFGPPSEAPDLSLIHI